MRYYEIIGISETDTPGSTHRKPLTPKQMVKRSERQRRTQNKIADVRSAASAKVADLQTKLP